MVVCSVCGRKLTSKSAIEAGIGPVCARKKWQMNKNNMKIGDFFEHLD